MTRKPIKVLVMSVGEYAKNKSARYLVQIGGRDKMVVCLPRQYEGNAESYIRKGIEVFVYDERKYINENFEYFGFKPRNCGGIGRQGIAEAVDRYGDEFLCFQIDDDYQHFSIKNERLKQGKKISKWRILEGYIRLLDEFYTATGIEVGARTGATIPDPSRGLFSNRKIFNNFIMRKGNGLNYEGFAALCSDDQRYNIYNNLLRLTPMLSEQRVSVIFNQNQGDRDDGNAVLYNGDCSWKKSFSLKIMLPWATYSGASKEENRVLFREWIEASKLYPPICLEENGVITAKL